MTIDGTFDALKIGDKFKFVAVAHTGKRQVWEKVSSSHARVVDDPNFELQIMDHANVEKINDE